MAGLGRNNMNVRTKTLVLDPLIGQHLKQYRIDGVIGQGGMGVVYRAQDLKLQRPVALKLLPTELTADAERRKRFIFEARAAARISHPAIAQVYDVDEHNGTIFIAMEMVEGKTIRQLIDDAQLDLLAAVDISLQVAAGLAKAHESGIVHRDIKPANIIQSAEGHIKILDFGLAKLLQEGITSTVAGRIQDLSSLTQTQIGTVKGTPAYMSPEQVKGEAIDARSDLFSLGVTLFEMTTGKLPFQRTSSTEIMHAIVFDKPQAMHSLQPNLPGDLERIVSRCLKKIPAERYPDARALIEDLRTLRRKMESGQASPLPLKEHARESFERLANLKRSEYVWLAGGFLVLALGLYLLTAHIGGNSFIALAIASLFIYRYIRHQPRRLCEQFVRNVARVPEVRFIACQDRRITVSVDRAAGHLYARINDQLNACNRKLFFGEPMSAVIRSDFTAEETRQWLSAPGVHYVRENTEWGN